MRPVLELVEKRSAIDDETVRALEFLLELARRGQVIGVVYAAVHRDKDYDIGVTGQSVKCPTYARGQLAALDDLLKDLIG